jgi:outer membrane protein assembly factor BamE (lipoprotein component of BamABCDE complex)
MYETMNRTRSLLLVCSVLAWTGCSYAIRPPIVEAGRSFPEDRNVEIKNGESPVQVRTVLGDPYETDGNENVGRWRYFMRIRGVEQRRLFGFIPVPDSKSLRDHETVVTFRNGRVESVTSSD